MVAALTQRARKRHSQETHIWQVRGADPQGAHGVQTGHHQHAGRPTCYRPFARDEHNSALHVSGCGGTTVVGKALRQTFIFDTRGSLDPSWTTEGAGKFITAGAGADGRIIEAQFDTNDEDSFRSDNVLKFIKS